MKTPAPRAATNHQGSAPKSASGAKTRTTPNAKPQPQPKPKSGAKPAISLALQGGGAHGAFTWGVVDALLESGRVSIPAVTATSAGAMNAVAFAAGWQEGGADGAREKLHHLWESVAQKGALFAPFANSKWANMTPFSPFAFFNAITNYASPYDLNPFDFNPLRDILDETIDFDAINHKEALTLFIAATSVRTGKARVFTNGNITREVVLASACLPQMFQAVKVDGESLWDGGYVANPALFPLFYSKAPNDVLIVHLNPIVSTCEPRSAGEIANRLNEITFNAALISELRAIAFVQRLLDENWLSQIVRPRYRKVLVHAIRADRALSDLSVESKFDTNWSFLLDLRDRGRHAAKSWLAQHGKDIGKKSSVDLNKEFLDPSWL